MASDGVYRGRVTSVASIAILSLMFQFRSCEFLTADAIPENFSKPIVLNEEIYQQQPVFRRNNQPEDNESNLIPEILSKDRNNDVHKTCSLILKNIIKRYEDMGKMYNIIMKIHKDILNSKDNIDKKFTSLVLNETVITEIRNKLSTDVKERTLKQQGFMMKQSEFDQNQKAFRERLTAIEKRQLRFNDDELSITLKVAELARGLAEITGEQRKVTAQLKDVIGTLKEIERNENRKPPPAKSTHLSTAKKPYIAKNKSEQAINMKIKETKSNFPFIAAKTVQEILKNKFQNDDVPNTFIIKVKKPDINNQAEQGFIDELQVENMKTNSYTELEDFIKKIYLNNSYIDNMAQAAQEGSINTFNYSVPDKVFQLLTVDTKFSPDGPRYRIKRSVDNVEIAHRSYPKFKKRRHRGLKKFHHPVEKKRALEWAATKEETTTFKYDAQNTDANSLLAQSYCNQIGQNNNRMTFNYCINKFLNRNQGDDMSPPKTKLIYHHAVPPALEKSPNHEIVKSSVKRLYRKQNIESNMHVTETTTEAQELTTIETRETTTEMNLTSPTSEDYTEREQELSVEIFDIDRRLPTIMIDKKEVTAKTVQELHTPDYDKRIDDVDGNIYWDDTVGAIKTPGKEKEAMENSYSDGEDYAILDADALVLLSKRKEYVEKYNSRILASESKKDEKKNEQKRTVENKKGEKINEDAKKEDKKKEDKRKEKHDRRRKLS